MKRTTPQVNLCPPVCVVELARQVMGQIDLDAWASPHSNLITGSVSGYDHTQLSVDEICSIDWEPPGAGRVLLSVPSGTKTARQLCNKLLGEYRRGLIQEAVIWLGPNEAITSLPWLWDHLVLMPWRRLRPMAWHDELQEFYAVSPGSWSAVIYLPPAAPHELRMTRISRFHVCAAPLGRVIAAEDAGDSDWQDSYAATNKAPYAFA